MGFLGRLFWSVAGLDKKRIPRELEILGASPELVAKAKPLSDVEQEEILVGFCEGKHACLVDWRDQRDQIYEALVPLLSAEEKKALPAMADLPEKASAAIVHIQRALGSSGRTLVHTESFGDFSFIFLVPSEKSEAFIGAIGPWLIKD